MPFVYILRCSDRTLYVGHTDNIEQRERTHNCGLGPRYTAARLPVELIYSEKVDSVADAVQRERQLKRWSGKKKEALVAGDIATLKQTQQAQTSQALEEAPGPIAMKRFASSRSGGHAQKQKKKRGTSRTKVQTAAQLDALHDAGQDLSDHLDVKGAKRPGRVTQRVNVDFPEDLLRAIDREAKRIGVTRQAFIKLRLADTVAPR